MPLEEPIEVLHLISTLDLGGAEQVLYRLLTGMDKIGRAHV